MHVHCAPEPRDRPVPTFGEYAPRAARTKELLSSAALKEQSGLSGPRRPHAMGLLASCCSSCSFFWPWLAASPPPSLSLRGRICSHLPLISNLKDVVFTVW